MRLSFLLLFLISSLAFADSKVIGKTYNVSEPDPYEEIADRASKIDMESMKDKIKEKQTFIKQFRVPALPRSEQANTILYTPTAISPTDIYGKDGLLYPKGFKFNPLEYRSMQGRIVIIDQSDIGKVEIQSLDTVILNRGDIKESSNLLKRPVYILDRITASTLQGLRTVPTIISQQEKQLRYDSLYIECQDDCLALNLVSRNQ